MAVTKERKGEQLKALIEKFGKSKSVVFANYRGLDVKSISDLRSALREGNAEMQVAKKTLIRLAAKDQGITDIDAEAMQGPVAATFSYEDEMSGIKVLFNFAKEKDKLKLLGGIIDGKVIEGTGACSRIVLVLAAVEEHDPVSRNERAAIGPITRDN